MTIIDERESKAPVVLFVYNRIDHTNLTLDALSENVGVSDTDLVIYSDAARNSDDEKAVNQVRYLLDTYDFSTFRSVRKVVRTSNQGLAANIIDGVTSACKEFGRVIVLEDDIVTSRYFLTYMNQALDMYHESKNVFSISGCSYPANLSLLDEDTYFMRIPLCWGWATWSDKWAYFEKDISVVPEIPRKTIWYINFDGSTKFFSQAVQNYRGKLNTWFIFWYITLVKNNGLSLFPKVSLVLNVGHDGTGENSSKSPLYNQNVGQVAPNVTKIEVIESLDAFNAHKRFFNSIRKPIVIRILTRLRKYFAGRG